MQPSRKKNPVQDQDVNSILVVPRKSQNFFVVFKANVSPDRIKKWKGASSRSSAAKKEYVQKKNISRRTIKA